MLVSVLMPALNAGPHLARVLGSLSAQSHTNWQLVFVDNGSTDETLQVAQGFQSRHSSQVEIYQLPRNLGNGNGCRQLAFEKGSGELVMWMDADDYLGRNTLQSQVEILKMHPGADAVHCDWISQVIGESDLPKKQRVYYESLNPEPFYEGCTLHRWAPVHSFLYRRQSIEAHVSHWRSHRSRLQDVEFNALNALHRLELVRNPHTRVFYNKHGSQQISGGSKQDLATAWSDYAKSLLQSVEGEETKESRALVYLRKYLDRRMPVCSPSRKGLFHSMGSNVALPLPSWHHYITQKSPLLHFEPYPLHDLILQAFDVGELAEPEQRVVV